MEKISWKPVTNSLSVKIMQISWWTIWLPRQKVIYSQYRIYDFNLRFKITLFFMWPDRLHTLPTHSLIKFGSIIVDHGQVWNMNESPCAFATIETCGNTNVHFESFELLPSDVKKIILFSKIQNKNY